MRGRVGMVWPVISAHDRGRWAPRDGYRGRGRPAPVPRPFFHLDPRKAFDELAETVSAFAPRSRWPASPGTAIRETSHQGLPQGPLAQCRPNHGLIGKSGTLIRLDFELMKLAAGTRRSRDRCANWRRRCGRGAYRARDRAPEFRRGGWFFRAPADPTRWRDSSARRPWRPRTPNIPAIHDFGTERGVKLCGDEPLDGELRAGPERGPLGWPWVERAWAGGRGSSVAHAAASCAPRLKPGEHLSSHGAKILTPPKSLAPIGLQGGRNHHAP
jgi:hypothetical protein